MRRICVRLALKASQSALSPSFAPGGSYRYKCPGSTEPKTDTVYPVPKKTAMITKEERLVQPYVLLALFTS